MKVIMRIACAILGNALILSCWGGQDGSVVVSREGEMIAQSTESCDEIITIGIGPGIHTEASDPPTAGLPDFITSSVKLYDATGTERYSYLQTETHKIHAIIGNIGDANWAGDRNDMYVTMFLSTGYKEDAHSEWKRVGTQQIKRRNIDVGDHKDEYFTVNLATLNNGIALTPGIYNYVVCPDRKYDQDNGDGEVPEKHKSNNCSTEVVFEVTADPEYVPPVPILTITRFEDEVGCCTTNTGSRIKPNIWIRNVGSALPASEVTVIYQIHSPVATGNVWWGIGYGGIRPDELTPGDTDEDYMDGNGWPIPKTSAWKKQWHTVRACIRADGSTPVGDPDRGDICASYSRYSKK